MRFKAVIFDLDGTLINTSLEHRTRVVNSVLSELGMPARTPEEADDLWFGMKGGRNKVLVSWGFDPEAFWDEFHRQDGPENRSKHTVVFDDITVLHKLKEQDVKLGLVTNAQQRFTEVMLLKFAPDLFDAVVMAHYQSNVKPKPHPEGILGCMQVLGASAHETAYVGNGPEDIAAARAAGVFDVLIERPGQPLPDAEPSMKVKSLHELYEKISD